MHRQASGASLHSSTWQLAESSPEFDKGMAKIELSVFSNQCLNRRISDEVVMKREVSSLEHERNEAGAVIDWRFSPLRTLALNFNTSIDHIQVETVLGASGEQPL